jgi:hypothetical protein
MELCVEAASAVGPITKRVRLAGKKIELAAQGVRAAAGAGS